MDEIKSKSQKKRDADALQKLGVKLIALSLDELKTLPLTEQLSRAIIEAKSLKSHGAVRRQAQLIGKLMRNADNDEIIAAYESMQAEDRAETAAFHAVETWRYRLITEDKEALTAFVAEYHPDDVQHLRFLIKKAIDERVTEKHTGAAKALFRYLRAYIL